KRKTNPLLVLRQVIRRVTPNIGVKTRRSKQGRALAIRWLLEASQKRPGQNMAFKLSFKLVNAAKGSGGTIRKKGPNPSYWYHTCIVFLPTYAIFPVSWVQIGLLDISLHIVSVDRKMPSNRTCQT
ncbi:hypothetical protein ZWY2020_047600, partial [Hordeum vulgare]